MRRYPIGRARPVDVVTEVFTKAQAIRDRWPHLPDNRFRWRMDRAHFDALFEATLERQHYSDETMRAFGLEHLEMARLERNAERRRLHEDAWGKPGSMLIGWPIVCDDTYPGIDPEVAYV